MSPELANLLSAVGIVLGGTLVGLFVSLGRLAKHVERNGSDVETLKAGNAEKDRKIARLELMAARLAGRQDVYIAQIRQLQQDLHTLDVHKNDLARLLKNATAEVAALRQSDMVQRRAHQIEIAGLNQRIQTLEDERDDNSKIIAKLTAQLAATMGGKNVPITFDGVRS